MKLVGHRVPVTQQSFPGKETEMPDPEPQFRNIPTEDGKYRAYKAAGKLKDQKALITGGDSGIGRATAVLFAMEGADSFITYLPSEKEDALKTKEMVEEHGRQCHIYAVDLTDRKGCKDVVDEAVSKFGGIDILFNNAAYQMMVESISDLSE